MGRIKKRYGILCGVVLLLVIGGAVHRAQVLKRWSQHQQRLDSLTLAVQRQTVPEFRDRHNLRFGFGRQALQPFFGAVEGLEIRAAAGHRVVMKRLDAQFEQGLIRVRAEAEFDSRLLFYRGPLVISYLAFSDIDADGRGVLRFWIEDLEIVRLPLFAKQWFHAWLMVTLQEAMPFPELALPLHFKTNLELPAVSRNIDKRNLTVTVPARSLLLQAREPMLAVEPQCLRAGAFTFPGTVPPAEPPSFAQPLCEREDLIGVAVSLDLLNQTLAAAFEPEVDVTLRSDRMTDVLDKQTSLLGQKVHNHLDIADFEGSLNIHEAVLQWRNSRLWLALNVSGRATGTMVGEVYGLPIRNFVEAEPRLNQKVPIRLAENEGRLTFEFEQEHLNLDANAAVTVFGRKVRASFPLELKLKVLSRALPVDQWFEKTYKVPRKIEGKQVVEEQEYRLVLNWKLDQAALDRQWLWVTADAIDLQPIVR